MAATTVAKRLIRSFFFVATFYVLHIVFCFIRFLLAIAFDWPIHGFGDDVSGPILFLIAFGLVTGLKFVVGYSLTEIFAAVDHTSFPLWIRYHPVLAACLSFVFLLIGLLLPAGYSAVSDNLVDSYLGFVFRLQWAPVLLGGVSSALATAAGIAVARRGRAQETPRV